MSGAGQKAPFSALGPGAEFDLIRRFLERGEAPAGAGADTVLVGPGDDCAVVDAGAPLALSTDLTVEGVHFRREWLAPEEVGYRATAAALSDLAAMAATPVAVLVSLGLPPERKEEATALMAGVRRAAHDCGAAVIGGDLSATAGPLFLDVVVAGAAPRPVLRGGARPGDGVWVTGWLGGAAAAVAAWLEGGVPSALARTAFAAPVPRLREAQWLARRLELSALIDLSDGLAGDAAHLAAASGVAIELEPQSLPLHAALGAGSEAARRMALGGGEDYELCFAAGDEAVRELAPEFTAAFGIPLTRVGAVRAGSGVTILGAGGQGELRQPPAGFRHFDGTAP
jgi:thiamine-monophosphate kinase